MTNRNLPRLGLVLICCWFNAATRQHTGSRSSRTGQREKYSTNYYLNPFKTHSPKLWGSQTFVYMHNIYVRKKRKSRLKVKNISSIIKNLLEQTEIVCVPVSIFAVGRKPWWKLSWNRQWDWFGAWFHRRPWKETSRGKACPNNWLHFKNAK